MTILATPTLSAGDKSQIVQELEKQAGGGGETVKNLLRTLAENNRLSLLGGVVNKFAELIAASRGEVEMTVTSAQVCVDQRQTTGIWDLRPVPVLQVLRTNDWWYSLWTIGLWPDSKLPCKSHPTSARARS